VGTEEKNKGDGRGGSPSSKKMFMHMHDGSAGGGGIKRRGEREGVGLTMGINRRWSREGGKGKCRQERIKK